MEAKIMTIHYYTNSAETTKSLTEWFFGKDFVTEASASLKKSGKSEIKVFQKGTGFLTIKVF